MYLFKIMKGSGSVEECGSVVDHDASGLSWSSGDSNILEDELVKTLWS